MPLGSVTVDYDEVTLAGYTSFNDTGTSWDADGSPDALVDEQFREQAGRYPQAPAISDSDQTLTYAQLDALTDRVAGRLIQAGCAPHDIVAVIACRGVSFVATVLGILRAGAVYLPVDPLLPPARMAQVLDSSRPALVVADTQVGQRLSELQPIRTVPLAELTAQGPAPSATPAGPAIGPEDPAYVIYTSGTTGSPKGAVVHHRGLINHLRLKIADLQMGPGDRLAQNSPQSFDISVWQMLAPLLVGACTHVLDDDVATDPHSLVDALSEQRITLLELVPSMLRVVLDVFRDARPGPLGMLRAIVVGGEEVLPSLVSDWFAGHPGVPLYNVYGPTECADDVSHCRFDRPPPAGTVHLPIGKPVANTQLWVFKGAPDGDGMRLCGIGEQGEVWVTGTGVGLGYLNDPERTRLAFFPDPFHAGGRMYRTGDLGVIGPDGLLTYLGRADRQVKVRGHRIELSEIESVLAEHPEVAAHAVDLRRRPVQRRAVARERLTETAAKSGASVLVAYVVTTITDPQGLRPWLAERLPRYMVPDQVVQVPAIPLTRNGKIDYRALPDPVGLRPDLDTPFTLPDGQYETAVAAAWCDALGVAPIGRDDDFLALGGESLLAMLIADRLSRRFGVPLRLRDLLRERTPGRLAALIASRREAAPVAQQVDRPAPQESSGRPHPDAVAQHGEPVRRELSIHQRGLWFHWQLAPENPYYNYLGSWSVRGRLDPEALGQAWRLLLDMHPVLTCRFVEEDGSPLLEYPWHQAQDPEYVDLSGCPAEEALARFRADAADDVHRPFDLGRDSLIRARLYRFSDDHHELLLATHEILLDGWAAVVLTRELAALYLQVLGGMPQRSAGTGEDDFARFLQWEAREVTRESLAQQRERWCTVLRGDLPVLRLPTDRPRPAEPTYRGDSVAAVLPSDLVERLRDVGRRNGATVFSTLLAAYGVLLARYSGQDEVMVGVPMANRHSDELHNTVGFLINMLPVRLNLDWDAPFGSFLKDVGGQVTEAMANCEYPFPWMVEDANVPRSAAISPVFQTMFNMLNYPVPPVAAEGLSFEFIELETGFTKYDMSLYAQPGDDGDIYLQVSYHTDLFDQATAQRILDGLVAACADIAGDETTPLEAISVMDAAHLRAVLNPGV
ncbi:amino acid adenylation domain-containing protein [Streptomyces canus]|uniref:amino acid adenylation domain-containing protein n=1 Tax=Streptomyces canus TaxID=58343 RepID=UPI0033BE854E